MTGNGSNQNPWHWIPIVMSFVLSLSSIPSGNAKNLPDDTIVYGALPTLFDSDHPFKGLTKKLDDLQDLGVTVIWLSPVTTSDDPSHISYAVTDYRGLREDFGSPEDLKFLVEEAHRRGMKVILDFVANHTSSQHPWFLDAETNGAASKYVDYYQKDADGNPVNYFDWDNLPNLNFDNPQVLKEIKEAMTFWMKDYGIDGFRMDAIWGVRERNAAALRSLYEELVAAHPDIILVAEAGARDPFYFEQGFQAAYDWNDQLGEWAWAEEFAKPEPNGRALVELTMQAAAPNKTLRFLNNNDTGERFATKHGIERTRAAVVFQFTIPGIPMIYSGDEVAAEFEPYEDSPPLTWKDPHNLRAFYKRLVGLRKQIPALHRAEIELVDVSGAQSVSAFLRRIDARSWAFVLVNFGKEREVTFTLPDSIKNDSSTLWDALNDCAVPLSEKQSITLRLHACGAAILVPNQALPAK